MHAINFNLPYSTDLFEFSRIMPFLNHRRQLDILMKIAIYGTKSYDREHFTRANKHFGFELEFLILCWMRKRRKWRKARKRFVFL